MNFAGKFAEIFVKRDQLTFLVLISLFIIGLAAFWKIPKQYNPTIVAPSFKIEVQFPGATREEVLEHVTRPLENVLSDIDGVEDIYSSTFNGGYVVVNVNFFVGEDFNQAKIALSDKIRSNMNFAPLGIPAPQITSVDPEDVPVAILSLASNTKSQIDLRKFAHKLRDRVRIIEQVSDVKIVGGRKRELAILVDQTQLKKYGISLGHIEETLKTNNVYLSSGVIKGESVYTPLEAYGLMENPQDIEEMVAISNDSINIRLKEIATVVEQEEEANYYVRHVFKRDSKVIVHDSIVLMSMAKKKGSNILDVAHRILKKIEQLKDGFIPKNIEVNVIVNEGKTASIEISNLVKNLITAISIVVAILLLFLSFKAGILVAISIPLTLATVFAVALLAGENINRITLFALILSLGLLVDNATVVIENIVRHFKNDTGTKDAKQLAVEAVNEVGPGLFMSTLTTVMAFIPLAYISGMMGPYMGPIPFFVPTALVISLLISLSINPWMAAKLLGNKKNHQKKEKIKILKKLEELGTGILFKYQRILEFLIFNKRKGGGLLLIVVLLLIFSILLPVFKVVKFRMLPKANVRQFFVYLDLPEGSSLNKTLLVTKQIENKLLENNEIVMAQSYVGTPPITDFNGLFRGVDQRRKYNQSTIRVGLTDPKRRDVTSEYIVLSMRPILEKFVAQIAGGIKLKLIEDPPGPPVLSTLLVRVQSDDRELVKKELQALTEKIQEIDGVVDLDTSLVEETETLQLQINHFEASRTQITPAQIVTAMNTLYSGKVIGIYHKKSNIEQEVIRLRFSKGLRVDKKALQGITIRNSKRISIPLSRLVNF